MSGWLWYVGAMWIGSRNILKIDPTRFLMDWMWYMRKITLVHIFGKMGLLLIEMKRQQLEQVGGGVKIRNLILDVLRLRWAVDNWRLNRQLD